MDNDIKRRRSKVRIWVTYIAATFVFGVGAGIIVYAMIVDIPDLAKDTFNVVLPIGTAVVTYWFAGRSAEKATEGRDDNGQNTKKPIAQDDGTGGGIDHDTAQGASSPRDD